jgi:diguanylate cyclase (GGDEF)-like protein
VLDQPLDLQEKCPSHNQECPVFDEVRHLREECKRLQELTQMDTLTGLFNFRYLMMALEGEMERTRRTGLSTGLIMSDLDHFKRINDTYGHECGNKALQWIGNIWHEKLRRIDMACRYGGEEFVVILPGTRLPQAIRAAERLRFALQSSPVKLNGKLVRLTASFGVDAYRGRKKLTVETFIKQTDHFLLEAKARGRNRVCYDENKITVAMEGLTPDEREALFATRRPER